LQALKRPKSLNEKKPNEEIGDNTNIWEYLARANGTFVEDQDFEDRY